MARPSVAHGGFIIPNAGDVSEPRLAEPDRVDFNTVANARWGVITGCLVTAQTGGSVRVQGGTAVVDGQFVLVKEATLQVTVPSGAPKFDLIVTDGSGNPTVVQGVQSNSPVLPDPLPTQTALAAILCVSGRPLADNVVDKRKLLAPNLLTQVPVTADIIRNFNAPGAAPTDPLKNYYRVLGSGETIWSNDTYLSRSDVGTLRVNDRLDVNVELLAGKATLRGDLTSQGNISAKNFRRSTGAPTSPGTNGDIWQDPSSGRVYVSRVIDGVRLWDELASMETSLPTATIIQSLQSPARMAEAGWLSLNGSTLVNENAHPTLFTVAALMPYSTGTAPNRTMILPNLTRRVLLTDFTNAGLYGPTARTAGNLVRLKAGQLPSESSKTKDAGGFSLKAEIAQSGSHTVPPHTHTNSDPGHKHKVGVRTLVGATTTEGAGAANVTVLTPFVSGKPQVFIDESYASISVGQPTSTTAGGPHSHPVTVAKVLDHFHNIDPWGNGDPIDITPDYFTVYSYIRG